MGVEIERRFLVKSSGWRSRSTGSSVLRQVYLAVTPAAAIRIRLDGEGCAWLTIKSGSAGIARAEFEYSIPSDDAETLLKMRTGHLIAKERFIVPAGTRRWEIDVFAGELAPLVIAEIELDDPQESFGRPDWLGAEITEDGRYSNASLALNGLPADFQCPKID
jgi:adenylate cyclase